jgi:hypothetical protein
VSEGVLSDPRLCPPKLVGHLARKVSRKFGGVVPVEDLEQVAWLELVRAAPGYDPARAKSLVHYALKGLVSRMLAYSWKWTRSGLTGAPPGVRVNLLGVRTPDRGRQTRLDRTPEGRADRGHRSDGVYVAPHALASYRKRFNPAGTRADVLRRLRASAPLAPHLAAQARLASRSDGTAVLLADGSAVFLVLPPRGWRTELNMPVVVGVQEVAMLEANWRQHGGLAAVELDAPTLVGNPECGPVDRVSVSLSSLTVLEGG